MKITGMYWVVDEFADVEVAGVEYEHEVTEEEFQRLFKSCYRGEYEWMNKDEALADIMAPLIKVAEEENQEILEGHHFVLGFAFEYPREVVEDVRKAKMRFCATGGSFVPADKNEPRKLEDKFPNACGFDAPAYGQVLGHDEKLVKQPNGLYKIVKISEEEKDE